ncbi:MAG: hypothetical protein AB7G39_07385 [Alphaproteobacteria bacterium]
MRNAEHGTGSPRKEGRNGSCFAFTLWLIAAVLALHVTPPADLSRVGPTLAGAEHVLGLSANDHPNQPYADLRNAVQVLGTETRSLLTKSTSPFTGFDDPVGQTPCGSSCMAFGVAANAPPAEASPPAAIVARAFQPRAPPSHLA